MSSTMGLGGYGSSDFNPPDAPGGTSSAFNPWGAKPQSSGGGGWFGSWHDPLGIVSGFKNIGSGLATTFGGFAANVGEGIGNVLTGNESKGLSNFEEAGKIGMSTLAGIGLGLEGLAANVPGVGAIEQKANKWMADNLGTWGATDQLKTELNAPGGYKPQNFFDTAHPVIQADA